MTMKVKDGGWLTVRYGISSLADVQRAIDVAFKYRNYFRKDIIVDLIVYRRWCVPFSSPLYSPFPPSPLPLPLFPSFPLFHGPARSR